MDFEFFRDLDRAAGQAGQRVVPVLMIFEIARRRPGRSSASRASRDV